MTDDLPEDLITPHQEYNDKTYSVNFCDNLSVDPLIFYHIRGLFLFNDKLP